MAFPASNGALSDVLERACQSALQMKAQTQVVRDRMAAGTVAASEIVQLDSYYRKRRAGFVEAASVAGIGSYAQEQLGSPGLDVVAEWNGMVAAIDSVLVWIRNNFPRDASGYLLAQTWGADGPVERTFTPTQTAGLRTQMDALVATVA